MRKIPLGEKCPELADQLVDQSLRDISSSSKERVRWRCDRGHEWDAIVIDRVHKGYGCPYCSGRLPISGETDLATIAPDVAAELVHVDEGATLSPTSHKKVWFRCSRGHEYQAMVADRVRNGSGCPYCSGRKPYRGETDLATTHPELAAELVDSSLATKLSKGSNKKVEWWCSICGNVWEAAPNSRVNMGSGCPYCAHKCVVAGDNDLATVRPDLAAQLVDLALATSLHEYSNRKVAWRCEKGHVWEALVSNRTQFDYGCPTCYANTFASRAEIEIGDFIEHELGVGDVSRNVRGVLSGHRELDVVLPVCAVAVEFNGLYWHSSGNHTPKDYHFRKYRDALAAGYRLIQIWEDEWRDCRELVQVRLRDTVFGFEGDVVLQLQESGAASWIFRVEGTPYVVSARIVGSSLVMSSTLVGLAAHQVRNLMEQVLDAIPSEISVERVRIELSNDYQDTRPYLENGFSVLADIPPRRLYTSQALGWVRVDEVCVADLSNVYEIYDAGGKMLSCDVSRFRRS